MGNLQDISHFFRRLKGSRVVIVGMGNELRGDDGVGVLVTKVLARRGLKEKVVEAGSNPELFVSKILSLNPEVVVFVDAVDGGLAPGEVVLVRITAGSSDVTALSTHSIPLPIVAEMIGVPCYLLGIQVGAVDVGSSITPRVREAGLQLAELLARELREG
ncbi:MAG: hydrogenase maturation protease [Infirmifilum sp.]